MAATGQGPVGRDPSGAPAALADDADLAITQLYSAHWHRLVRLAWLLLHDQHAAEDAVQDAFVATHRHWSSIRESGRAVGYLQTAVVNACRSAQRHNVVVDRQNARDLGAADAPGRHSVDSAEAHAMRRSQREAMVAALRDLPARQREVLVLRYYGDFSEAQIADALDIAPGSVKAHAHRGLNTLRRALPTQRLYDFPTPEVDQP